MAESLELILRWIFGLQITFWGLNAFFHWKQIPPSAEVIDDFTQACIKSKFIMPTVKVFEIVFGIFLLAGYHMLLSLAALVPIVFVISGLHLCHSKKPWPLIASLTSPFLGLIILEYENWKTLFLN